MMHRVAFYCSSFQPGGVQRARNNLVEGLNAVGIAADVIVIQSQGPLRPPESPLLRIIDLHANSARAGFSALAGYLRREKPDVLLAAQPYQNLVALAARALARPSMRLLVSEHTNVQTAIHTERRMKDRLLAQTACWAYHLADGVIAVSRGVADSIARSGGPARKVKVIYNPIVSPRLAESAILPIDHPWLTDKQKPVTIAVGRLVEHKDYPTLLKAFAILAQSMPARLIILGDGPELDGLKTLALSLGIADCVDFHGAVANPYPFMAHSNVLALSSRVEGFPSVLIEALALGVPVVAADCQSGPAECLENGKYGRLTPVGDARALAAALGETLAAPVDRQALMRRAQEFSTERILPQYLAAFFPGEYPGA